MAACVRNAARILQLSPKFVKLSKVPVRQYAWKPFWSSWFSKSEQKKIDESDKVQAKDKTDGFSVSDQINKTVGTDIKDDIVADQDNKVVVADDKDDIVIADKDNKVIIADDKDDIVVADQDNKIVAADDKDDVIIADQDNKIVAADDKDDIVVADQDNKVVVADDKDDIVVADQDNKVVVADDKDDIVVADQDNKVVIADDKDDIIVADQNDDVVVADQANRIVASDEEELVTKIHEDMIMEAVEEDNIWHGQEIIEDRNILRGQEIEESSEFSRKAVEAICKAQHRPSSDMPNRRMKNPYKVLRIEKCILCRYNVPVDYKNVALLSQFVSRTTGRILPSSQTGLCIPMQQRVSRQIQRARKFGFMPHTSRHRDYMSIPEMRPGPRHKSK